MIDEQTMIHLRQICGLAEGNPLPQVVMDEYETYMFGYNRIGGGSIRPVDLVTIVRIAKIRNEFRKALLASGVEKSKVDSIVPSFNKKTVASDSLPGPIPPEDIIKDSVEDGFDDDDDDDDDDEKVRDFDDKEEIIMAGGDQGVVPVSDAFDDAFSDETDSEVNKELEMLQDWAEKGEGTPVIVVGDDDDAGEGTFLGLGEIPGTLRVRVNDDEADFRDIPLESVKIKD